jgi:tetrahydromethanopterin S-methyltransferase subunit A
MTYIDKLINEMAKDIATEMCISEINWTKFFAGALLGLTIGIVFGLILCIEAYIYLPK